MSTKRGGAGGGGGGMNERFPAGVDSLSPQVIKQQQKKKKVFPPEGHNSSSQCGAQSQLSGAGTRQLE